MNLSFRTRLGALALVSLAVLAAACAGSDDSATERTLDATAEPIPAPTATPVPEPAPSSPLNVGDGGTGVLPPLTFASVVVSVDGGLNEGSGVAFLRDDGIHARLLIGPPNEYLQFDLVAGLDETGSSFTTGENSPAVVYGQDAVSEEYEVVDGPATNTFTVSHNVPAVGEDSVEGTLDVTVRHTNGDTYRMTGAFLLPASGGTEWVCDWQGPVVADCRFLDE